MPDYFALQKLLGLELVQYPARNVFALEFASKIYETQCPTEAARLRMGPIPWRYAGHSRIYGIHFVSHEKGPLSGDFNMISGCVPLISAARCF